MAAARISHRKRAKAANRKAAKVTYHHDRDRHGKIISKIMDMLDMFVTV